MRVVLIPLTQDEHKRLVALIAGQSPTVAARQGLLESAGLDFLVSRVSLETNGETFATELIRVLQRHGQLNATGIPALRPLLNELKQHYVGHEADADFLDVLLSRPSVVALPPVDTQLGNIRISWLRWSIIIGTLGVVVIAAGLTIFQNIRMLQPTSVTPMSAGFNVLVAGFGAVDINGQPIRSPESQEVSALFASRLERAITANLTGLPDVPHVRYVATTNLQTTTNPQEIETIVAQLEHEHNANMVVYGILTVDDKATLAPFRPVFYTDYRGYARERDIIDGENALGKPFLVPMPFDAQELQGIENSELEVRPQILALLIIGLSFDARNNYERALEYYERALSFTGWDEATGGKEIAFVLAGNALGQWSSRQTEDNLVREGLLDEAEEYYRQALVLDPHYGRAMVGLHSVRYLQAIDYIETGDIPEGLNLLEEAGHLLDESLLPENEVTGANLPVKVHFGKGQIQLVLYYINAEEPLFLMLAQDEFEKVLLDYESADEVNQGRLQEYAAHAHGRLGLIARLQDQLAVAIEEYQTASVLASPYYQSQYACLQGQVLIGQGKQEAAKTLLEEAQAVVDFNQLELPLDCITLKTSIEP